jgi:hypothetical protein
LFHFLSGESSSFGMASICCQFHHLKLCFHVLSA